MNKRVLILMIACLFVSMQICFSQSDSVLVRNTVKENSSVPDTLSTGNRSVLFKPNPKKALFYSMLVPGLGQIYNRKYWKVPIVYAGYAALIYAISWNGAYYNSYKKEYISIADEDPLTEDYVNRIPSGEDVAAFKANSSDMAWLEQVLNQKRQSYRYNRDLSIIGIVAFYGITILDAYVDAQLYDFDISPDLSLRVEPFFNNNFDFNSTTLGLRCQLTF